MRSDRIPTLQSKLALILTLARSASEYGLTKISTPRPLYSCGGTGLTCKNRMQNVRQDSNRFVQLGWSLIPSAVRYKNWKFVKTTTTEGSPQFVPPEARIATVLAEAGSEADDENLCLGFSILFSTN